MWLCVVLMSLLYTGGMPRLHVLCHLLGCHSGNDGHRQAGPQSCRKTTQRLHTLIHDPLMLTVATLAGLALGALGIEDALGTVTRGDLDLVTLLVHVAWG